MACADCYESLRKMIRKIAPGTSILFGSGNPPNTPIPKNSDSVYIDNSGDIYKWDILTQQWSLKVTGGGSGGSATFAQNIGDGVATSIVVTHGLGTGDLTFSIREIASGEYVDTEKHYVDPNNTRFVFSTAPATNSIRVVIKL